MSTPEPAICPAPLANHLKPSFTLPPGATDCHAHVFGAREVYGYADNRLYTPPPGVLLKEYLAMLDGIGFSRGVMVHTGVHGTNNQVVLDAMAQTGVRLRAIALLREDVTDTELEALDKAGVRIALTTHGLKEPQEFLPAIRKAVARGLSPQSALRALTIHPATMFGVADRCGSIEPGKIANLVITDGDLFSQKTKILATWIHGQRHEVEKPAPFDARGTWELTWKDKPDQALLWLTLQGEKPGDLRGELSTTKPGSMRTMVANPPYARPTHLCHHGATRLRGSPSSRTRSAARSSIATATASR